MRKRGRPATTTKKKPSAADLLASPPERANHRSSDSPKSFEFKLESAPPPPTNTVTRRRSVATTVEKKDASSPLRRTEAAFPSSSISELKEVVTSRLESIKRQVDRSHSDVVKEVESSHSRLHKRFKIQAQACQQLMDATEKEFKKMSERINESSEAMKVSYTEFIVEAQTTASRVYKSTIPEKVQSFEKAMDALRSRYGILSTPV